MTNSIELLNIAKQIAIAAGDFLQSRPENFKLSEKGSALDFATQMDIECEAFIVEQIRKLRPTDAILGEEGGNEKGTSGLTWVIDPIDGTVNYLYGIPGWCVSIAVKDEKEVLAGVVNAPSVNSLWSAALGAGATCNEVRIACNEPVTLNRALVGTGFAYDLTARKPQGDFVNKLVTKVRDIRRLGACAADICMVASGKLDAYYEAGVNEWDFAAAGLIAREAGAMVLARANVPSTDQYFLLVAGPSLYRELAQELIADGRWLSAI